MGEYHFYRIPFHSRTSIMADAPAAQGYAIRPNPVVYTKRKGFWLQIWLFIQIAITVSVLGLALGLIATQPSGAAAAQVNLAVFVAIFTLLSWFYIFVFARRFEFYVPVKPMSIAIGFVASVFLLAAALALTVALAPAGSCESDVYLKANSIMAGIPSRCRTLEATVGLIWFGIPCPSSRS